MKQDEIIEMARQAGIIFGYPAYHDRIEIFAKLVAAKEREVAAEKCGEFARKWWSIHCATNKHMETTKKAHVDFCVLQSAIRARGEA